MTHTPTLIPAYGRDYTSAAKAKADLLAGKDFLIADTFGPLARWSGKPISLVELQLEGITSVKLRYRNLTNVTIARIDTREATGA